MKGLPQQPDPSKLGLQVPICVRFDQEPRQDQDAEEVHAPRRPLRMRITKAVLDKYGYTEGCEGCRRRAAGLDKHDHSEICRARIWDAMGLDPQGQQQREYQQRRMANRAAAQRPAQQHSAGRPDDNPPVPVPSGAAVVVPLAGDSHPIEGAVPVTPTIGPSAPSVTVSEPSVSGDQDSSERSGRDGMEESGGASGPLVEPSVPGQPQRYDIGTPAGIRTPEARRARSRSRGRSPPGNAEHRLVPNSPILVEGERTGMKRDATPDGSTVKRPRPGTDDVQAEDLMTDESPQRQLQLHQALDLTLQWNFAWESHRTMALDLVSRATPRIIIGGGACARDQRSGRWRESARHIQFLGQLYRGQVQDGRWYLHAHPTTSSRMLQRQTIDMLDELQALTVERQDIQHPRATGQAMTGVRLHTNSHEVAQELSSHAPMIEAIRQGVQREAAQEELGLRKIAVVGPHTHITGAAPEEEEEDSQPSWDAAWDDVSGEYLDLDRVRAARATEMDYINGRGFGPSSPA